MAEKKDKVAAEPAKKTNAALDAVLSQIKKEFGELSIMRSAARNMRTSR